MTGALIGVVQDEHGGLHRRRRGSHQFDGAHRQPGIADDERERASCGSCRCLPVSTSSTSSSRGSRAGTKRISRSGRRHPRATRFACGCHRLSEPVIVEGAAPASRREILDSLPVSAPRISGRSRRVERACSTSIRAAPGLSPTSPTSGTTTTVSAFGSGTNENQFLFDGMNNTCPCNGVARAEPGVDFIQEVHVQSIGASAEFGNVQGAVINVVTKQGATVSLFDGAYYGQTASLTSQPVALPLPDAFDGTDRLRAGTVPRLTASVGGPAVRDRLWFFAGHQYLRDYDSQPGTDPALPRTYEQNKSFAKLTWRLAPGLQLVQSVHHEFWVNPDHADARHAVRGDLAHARIGAGHQLRSSVARGVAQYRLGGAGRTFCLLAEGEPSTGNRTDAEPVRSRDRRHERRAFNNLAN